MAIDASGNAVAVWWQNDGTRFDIRARHYAPGTDTWSTAPLSLTATAGSGDAPQVSFDAAGNAVAVWAQWDDLFYDICWSTPALLETLAGQALRPQIAVDGNGDAIAVWDQFDGSRSSIWASLYRGSARPIGSGPPTKGQGVAASVP